MSYIEYKLLMLIGVVVIVFFAAFFYRLATGERLEEWVQRVQQRRQRD